jgi:hypothetical protein
VQLAPGSVTKGGWELLEMPELLEPSELLETSGLLEPSELLETLGLLEPSELLESIPPSWLLELLLLLLLISGSESFEEHPQKTMPAKDSNAKSVNKTL